jgi:hypothetical protein
MCIYFFYNYAAYYKGEKCCQLPRLHAVSYMEMKYGYVTLVELYLQLKMKILGVKPNPLSLSTTSKFYMY